MNRRALALALLSVVVSGCGGEAFEALMSAPDPIDSGSEDPRTEPGDDAGSNPPQDGAIPPDDRTDDQTPDRPATGEAGGQGGDPGTGGAGGTGGTGGTSPDVDAGGSGGSPGTGGTGGTSPDVDAGGSGGSPGTGGTGGDPGTGGAGGTGGTGGTSPDGTACAADPECVSGFCDGQPDGAPLCVGPWIAGSAYAACGNECPDPLLVSCGCGALVVEGGRLWRCRMMCGTIRPGPEQSAWTFIRGALLPPGAWCVDGAECASGSCNEPEGGQPVCGG